MASTVSEWSAECLSAVLLRWIDFSSAASGRKATNSDAHVLLRHPTTNSDAHVLLQQILTLTTNSDAHVLLRIMLFHQHAVIYDMMFRGDFIV